MNPKLENLTKYFNQIDNANNQLRKTMMGVIILCVGCMIGCIIFSFYMYKESTTSSWVMDKDGNIASTFKTDISGQKQVEIDNHIRMIYDSFFTYTSTNYKNKVDKGLPLMGNNGKQLFLTLSSSGWFNMVVQNNLTVNSIVDSIKINSNIKPYKFKSYGRQFVRRHNIIEERRLFLDGEINDDARVLNKNPHGLKADFIITDNRTIKADSIKSSSDNSLSY